MSLTSDQRSRDFLKIADQFKLGALTTETSHPVTANLSDVARKDIAAGLKQLFDVDDDVVRKYREFVESGRARGIADTLRDALKNGGNVFLPAAVRRGGSVFNSFPSGAISGSDIVAAEVTRLILKKCQSLLTSAATEMRIGRIARFR